MLNKRVWNYLPDGSSNILYDILQPQIANGERVYGYRVDGMRWFETGNIQDYLQATRICLDELRTGSRLGKCLENILEAHAPPFGQSSDWSQRRLIADSAKVSSSASLKGFQVVGESEIADHTQLEDCVTLPLAKVEASTTHRLEVLL